MTRVVIIATKITNEKMTVKGKITENHMKNLPCIDEKQELYDMNKFENVISKEDAVRPS